MAYEFKKMKGIILMQQTGIVRKKSLGNVLKHSNDTLRVYAFGSLVLLVKQNAFQKHNITFNKIYLMFSVLICTGTDISIV